MNRFPQASKRMLQKRKFCPVKPQQNCLMSTPVLSTPSVPEVSLKRSNSGRIASVLPSRPLTTFYPVPQNPENQLCVLCGEDSIPAMYVCAKCKDQLEREQQPDIMNINQKLQNSKSNARK